MIDIGMRPLKFMFVCSVLAALLACTLARANGDHPSRLPPPDPGPALARIAATPEVAPQPPVPVPPPFEVAREPGQAIFSPFAASAAAGPSNAVVAPAGSSDTHNMMFAILVALGCLAGGGYLWHRVRQAS